MSTFAKKAKIVAGKNWKFEVLKSNAVLGKSFLLRKLSCLHIFCQISHQVLFTVCKIRDVFGKIIIFPRRMGFLSEFFLENN
jgi:hypothetical protein